MWGIAVTSEVVLFAAAPRILPQITPTGLLLAGALAGAVRWVTFPIGETAAFFVMNSILHAGSFGAAHLGLQRLIGARVSEARQGAAQGLAFALSGPTMAIATFASGPLFGAYGATAFIAMASMCTVGAVTAMLARHPQRDGDGGETIEPV